ncbi:MAG: hypothetical protein ACOWW1_05150 [archaeon]|nr:hypothetical protein [Candidatus Bathyarchaeum sp.]
MLIGIAVFIGMAGHHCDLDWTLVVQFVNPCRNNVCIRTMIVSKTMKKHPDIFSYSKGSAADKESMLKKTVSKNLLFKYMFVLNLGVMKAGKRR